LVDGRAIIRFFTIFFHGPNAPARPFYISFQTLQPATGANGFFTTGTLRRPAGIGKCAFDGTVLGMTKTK
jgi:hypothetical protein